MVVIGVIASAIAIPLALIIPWFPSKGSVQAGNISTLYDVLLITTIPIFVLVETVVLFSVWKFRMRPGPGGDGRPADPRQHAARGRVDRGSRDPDRVAVHLRVLGAAHE